MEILLNFLFSLAATLSFEVYRYCDELKLAMNKVYLTQSVVIVIRKKLKK